MNVVQSPPMKFLRISSEETRVRRRGFTCDSREIRERIEQIGEGFLIGYHAALRQPLLRIDHAVLFAQLNACVDLADTGFAFEGAGMALALLDGLVPFGPRRLQGFLQEAPSRHVYMLHVGAGWAIARLPWLRWNLDAVLATMDPLLRWLAVDGYGFHEGYFHWQDSVRTQRVSRCVKGYARRAFDQGLGRSLWFVEGASVHRVAATIARFPSERQSDLWSGVGLASAYAGGVSRHSIVELARLGRTWRRELAQGAAFAAKTRQRAGNPAVHTCTACEILCGVSAEEAAGITDRALEGVSREGSGDSYETWRHNIRNSFQRPAVRPISPEREVNV
jgi:hypothetical protein